MIHICDKKYPQDNVKYKDIFNEYPFELDHFQKYAIEAIENDKHVLITAATGSGKTLPSEYVNLTILIDWFLTNYLTNKFLGML